MFLIGYLLSCISVWMVDGRECFVLQGWRDFIPLFLYCGGIGFRLRLCGLVLLEDMAMYENWWGVGGWVKEFMVVLGEAATFCGSMKVWVYTCMGW